MKYAQLTFKWMLQQQRPWTNAKIQIKLTHVLKEEILRNNHIKYITNIKFN